MGLSNIRSRISSLNGKFELSSSVGKGMSAKIAVSINGENLHLSPRDLREIKEMEDNSKKRKEKWQRKR